MNCTHEVKAVGTGCEAGHRSRFSHDQGLESMLSRAVLPPPSLTTCPPCCAGSPSTCPDIIRGRKAVATIQRVNPTFLWPLGSDHCRHEGTSPVYSVSEIEVDSFTEGLAAPAMVWHGYSRSSRDTSWPGCQLTRRQTTA